uniref:Uncharacterized protein n=1 Tax=Arundo donax TaxID=35708 RepID=A0A0A9H419_ARUDO
MVPYITCLYLM